MLKTLINPFFFESPADRWSFTDREELLPMVQRAMGEQGRRMLFHGRRRMGKTSLLRNAARQIKQGFLYVDLSTATDLTEVANKLLRAMPPRSDGMAAKALKLLQKYFRNLALEAGHWRISGDLRPEAAEGNLEAVLDYLDEQAAVTDEPLTICLDEFQDMRELGGPRAEWRLRGVIQHHRHLNYFFSGSDHRLLAWMTEPQAAFYKQLVTVEVGPIDPAKLAAWLDERARRGGWAGAECGAAIVALAGPCTGDVVKLARGVFELKAAGKHPSVEAAFDAIALRDLHNEYVAFWRPCTVVQRAVLRAMADGRPPQASDTLRAYGIRSASSAQTAIAALIDRQLLTRDADALIFESPFFRRWVDANGVNPSGHRVQLLKPAARKPGGINSEAKKP